MSDLVRQDVILGNSKTIVGNVNQDLVLETLGTLYIRLLNTFIDLVEYIENLISSGQSDTPAVNILSDIKNIKVADYNDGDFIYDKSTMRLYFKLLDSFNLIADLRLSSNSDAFVRTDGSIPMQNSLTINTSSAPLIVLSRALVKNLNSNYIEGYSADSLAKKALNESITGLWTFLNDVVAQQNIRQKGDFITDGSIGSPLFVSGMSGYGWRLDANTNTLTIDNLVVRGVLSVFELVVNKITATNGSLWVTDAFKVGDVAEVKCVDLKKLTTIGDLDSVVDLAEKECIIFYNSENNYNYLKISGKPSYNRDGTLKEDVSYDVFTYVYFKKLELAADMTFQLALDNECFSYEYLYGTETTYEEETRVESPIFYKFNRALFEFVPPTAVDSNGEFDTPNIKRIYTYYNYFGNNRIYSLKPEEGLDYPVFKSGDILLCQKFDGKNVKRYNAIVLSVYSDRVLVLLASSFLDYTIELNYDESGKLVGYTCEKNDDRDGDCLGTPESEDSIVRVGNIFNVDRQGSLYLTSSESLSPYMDVMQKVDRPDYTVMYYTPKYETFKAKGIEYYLLRNGTGYLENNTDWYKLSDGSLVKYGCRYITGNEVYVYTNEENTRAKTALNSNTRLRLGNLEGIYNETFGNKQPHGYGLYGDNVYLTGEFYLNNGTSVFEIGELIKSITADDGIIDTKLEELKNTIKEEIKDLANDNLLRNSDNFKEANLTLIFNGNKNNECEVITPTEEEFNLYKALKITKDYENSSYPGVRFQMACEPEYLCGKLVTFSCYIKASEETVENLFKNNVMIGSTFYTSKGRRQAYVNIDTPTYRAAIMERWLNAFTYDGDADFTKWLKVYITFNFFDKINYKEICTAEGNTPGYQYADEEDVVGPELYIYCRTVKDLTPAEKEITFYITLPKLELGDKATAYKKADAIDTIEGNFGSLLLNNKSAFAYAFGTSAGTPDGGEAFASTYALGAGRAGLLLIGTEYDSASGKVKQSDSAIKLIADKIAIDNYITTTLDSKLYTLILFLEGITSPDDISQAKSKSLKWAYNYPSSNNLSGGNPKVNYIDVNMPDYFKAKLLNETAYFKYYYNYETSGETILRNITNESPYIDSTETHSTTNGIYVLATITSALFENGKIASSLIETGNLVVYDKSLGIPLKEDFNADNFSPNYRETPYIGDKDGSYVVISGKTGKIYAKNGEFNGRVLVGTDTSEAIDINNSTTPKISIYNKERRLISEFSGDIHNSLEEINNIINSNRGAIPGTLSVDGSTKTNSNDAVSYYPISYKNTDSGSSIKDPGEFETGLI